MELTTDDPCAGLEAPDGRSFRPDRCGVLRLPEDLAAYGRQAARVTPLFHVRRPGWAGFDAAALRERYAAWEREGAGASAVRSGPVGERRHTIAGGQGDERDGRHGSAGPVRIE